MIMQNELKTYSPRYWKEEEMKLSLKKVAYLSLELQVPDGRRIDVDAIFQFSSISSNGKAICLQSLFKNMDDGWIEHSTKGNIVPSLADFVNA